MGLKIYAIAAGIKNYKSIIKKKKMKHDKIVLLAKSKLDSIEVLISKTLIDPNISHDEFLSINNVLKEYDRMKQEIKKRLNRSSDLARVAKVFDCAGKFSLFIKQCHRIVWSVEKIPKVKFQICKDKKRKNNAFIKMRNLWQ